MEPIDKYMIAQLSFMVFSFICGGLNFRISTLDDVTKRMKTFLLFTLCTIGLVASLVFSTYYVRKDCSLMSGEKRQKSLGVMPAPSQEERCSQRVHE
jgi:Ca2+/H+ antiporter